MKHYTDQDFVNLLEAVERQGGEYVPETCIPHRVKELDLQHAKPVYSTGCAEDALFVVPYDAHATVTVDEPVLIPDPQNASRKIQKRDDDGTLHSHPVEHSDEGGSVGELHMIRVCANDDFMRRWPRFQDAMKDPDPMTGVR